jgi:hypothetical protein
VTASAATPGPGGYSADALYNAANAYARAGNTGLAVLYYERAELLVPGDPDIVANLHYVRTAAQLPDAPPGVFARIPTLASPDALAWVGILGLVCLGSALLIQWSAHRVLRMLLVGVGAATLGLAVASAIVVWPRLQAGVVLGAGTAVRATPAPMGDELFPMRAGETVRIEAERDDFLFVRTAEGREGWVARAAVASVIPRTAGSESP